MTVRCATALAAVIVALLVCAGAVFAANATTVPPTLYDRVLTVGFSSSADAAERAATRSDAGVKARAALAAPGVQQVVVPPGQSIGAAVASLDASANVDFVEPPGSYTATSLTNDPYVVNLNTWGLNNTGQAFACKVATVGGVCPDGQSLAGTNDADVDAPEAWSVYSGGGEPIAIVDTGVAWQHQDLAANIWTNSAESAGTPGVDDDPYTGIGGNSRSYVDDLHGWDFIGDINNNGTPADPTDDTRYPPDNNPSDPAAHGTHVAGIAGAVGDNLKGVAGVNPHARIMPLRAADEAGRFSFGAIEDAFSYAIDHGVRVINGSFSGPAPSPGMSAIIYANPQVLFIFAAGNGARNHDDASGAKHQFPCDIAAPNVICVAATDWNDQLSSFSDYGYNSVDLTAPGQAILSTVPSVSDAATGGDYDYQYMDGTSMAAPFVSGAASLIWSAHPSLDSSQVKTLLVQNVDPLTSVYGKVGFGGRLNVDRALVAAASPPPPGWPVTPPAPDGAGGGSPPPINIPDTSPPRVQVVSAHRMRDGAAGKLAFNVICGENCTITTVARPNVPGVHPVTTTCSGVSGMARTVRLRFRGDSLARVRRAIDRRGRVGVFVTVTVTDSAGNSAPPRSFRISLVR